MDKYVIFGDVHGRSIELLKNYAKSYDYSAVLCLGDVATTESIAQIFRWSRECQYQHKAFYSVCGNHDYLILNGNYTYPGQSAEIEGKRNIELWKTSPKSLAKLKYVFCANNGVPRTKIVGQIGTFDCEAMHGFARNETVTQYLSGFVEDEANIIAAANRLRRHDRSLSIYGHSHRPGILRVDTSDRIEWINPYDNQVIDIAKPSTYFLNPGAWEKGQFATLETFGPNLRVTFRRCSLPTPWLVAQKNSSKKLHMLTESHIPTASGAANGFK